MHYCFNEFFYLYMASNYRPNGYKCSKLICQILGGPKLTRKGHFALQPIALLFPLSLLFPLFGCFSPQWWREILVLKLICYSCGLLLLILWASIGWFHGMAFELSCPYGWALKLMSWGLLWTHLELILDGYFKCVGCTCGLWAWMARDLIIMGFRLIV